MRIAVIGTGIAGNTAAWKLRERHDITVYEAADYIGRVSQEVQQAHASALQAAGVNGEVTWLLGGQISGQPHSLMLIYPQGNYIEASESTPYLQIGETKYGKPVLDRVLEYSTSLEDAAKLALVSLT